MHGFNVLNVFSAECNLELKKCRVLHMKNKGILLEGKSDFQNNRYIKHVLGGNRHQIRVQVRVIEIFEKFKLRLVFLYIR